MKKIIKITESDLIKIIKRIVSEDTDSKSPSVLNKYQGMFFKTKTQPLNYNAIVFNKKMTFGEAEKIINSLGGIYVLPKEMENYKNTFNSGEFWEDKSSGTYRRGFYDFQEKTGMNGHPNHEKKLMLIKK